MLEFVTPAAEDPPKYTAQKVLGQPLPCPRVEAAGGTLCFVPTFEAQPVGQRACLIAVEDWVDWKEGQTVEQSIVEHVQAADNVDKKWVPYVVLSWGKLACITCMCAMAASQAIHHQ